MDGVEKQQIAWQTRLRETTLDFPFFVVMCRTNAEEKNRKKTRRLYHAEMRRRKEEEVYGRGEFARRGKRRMKDSTNLWGKRTFETN